MYSTTCIPTVTHYVKVKEIENFADHYCLFTIIIFTLFHNCCCHAERDQKRFPQIVDPIHVSQSGSISSMGNENKQFLLTPISILSDL